MEEILDLETPPQKIYTDRSISWATFLGGPLVAGYLIAENFKALNEPAKVQKTWVYAILATIFIFGISFLIPDEVKLPTQVFPVIYSVITYRLVKILQGNLIAAHVQSGGELHSGWRAFSVGLIGLVVTFVVAFVVILITEQLT